MTKPNVIVGDGWAALGAVAFHAAAEKPVLWISGSGSRMIAALPALDVSESTAAGASAWIQLTRLFGLETGEVQTGSFTREFRNKAFRDVAWTQAPTPEERVSVREEMLWAPEQVLAPVFEGRFSRLTLAEIEEKIRLALAENSAIRRIESVPLMGVESKDGAVTAVRLANGETIECDSIFFADRWSSLAQIEGLPKGLAFARKRGAVGVLQAEFTHELPLAAAIQEGFYGPLHKESGEEFERHVWGFFSSDGARSFWTLCVSPEEIEDNHAIAKKLRRMKTALDKMFSGSGWLPEGKESFLANVRSERVRFEESAIFSEGKIPAEVIEIPGLSGIRFLTDGYGPASALQQVVLALPEELSRASAQAEEENAAETTLA